MRLTRSFFARDTIVVAKEFLGKILVRRIGKKIIKARIIETEAYIGEQDQACHARFGRTKRNAPMYGPAGHAYIYLCYGVHELLNIVTEEKDLPAAVLIRVVDVVDVNRCNMAFGDDRRQKPYFNELKIGVKLLGPGSLTKFLEITRELNGEDLTKSKKLRVVDDGFKIKKSRIKSAERIGVSYAGKWAKRRWRFYFDL